MVYIVILCSRGDKDDDNDHDDDDDDEAERGDCQGLCYQQQEGAGYTVRNWWNDYDEHDYNW